MSLTMNFVLALLFLAHQVLAVHFYLPAGENKQCINLVLGRDSLLAEKHSAWEYEESTEKWVRDDMLSIEVTIEELFDNNERVYSHKQSPFGQFQYVTQEAGEHRICFSALQDGWWCKNKVKLEVDFTLGSEDLIDSTRERQVGSIVDRVGELNRMLVSLHHEQVIMHEFEASFRDQSEATNARVARLTLLQLFVIVGTCAWQVSHLRSFFTKQKLV